MSAIERQGSPVLRPYPQRGWLIAENRSQQLVRKPGALPCPPHVERAKLKGLHWIRIAGWRTAREGDYFRPQGTDDYLVTGCSNIEPPSVRKFLMGSSCLKVLG